MSTNQHTLDTLIRDLEELEKYRYPLPLFYWASRGWRGIVFAKSPDFQIIKQTYHDEATKKWKYLFFIIFLAITGKMLSYKYHIISLSILFILMIIYPSSLLMNILFFIPKSLGKIAKENDDKLRSIGQEYINSITKYFKKHKIDPREHPLRLRHDDYKGLRYEKRGEHDYIAYVVVE